ncbi:2-C-methyl-D-erythritol 4-phosphate cytidylyltransferase [Reichenbachiella ulvae]|uniref:2-C-methyl-D-erythritol 4-phosphate cytidylyltransferase n=1 Tax=Reichenbachiella ulvae TaxID=2980104 RepID=A0ABT3CQ66_9BACT|nr:2-C-methyl-D-erythritol 4-phosphate cytidylyltransferase [Reichenbachiella ulvae]MCV9385605.1 2-C-methyl-D-erythritol 4-phosphate cytidylyltransferase [Reichenbachiella ulvae]
MKKYAIIVAGGSGSRMQSELPKQFLVLSGKPILLHTLEAFHLFDSEMELIVVLPETHSDTWELLKKEHQCNIPHMTIQGGDTRFDSVQNGLSSIIDQEGLVAIHDGARPLVSPQVIARTFESAEKNGNGIAAVALKDSLRTMVAGENQAVDRSSYLAIQTPQTFRLDLIKLAFDKAQGNAFTDDASVAEADGRKIHLVEGDYANIKVTTPEDLVIAEALLKHHKQ